jgi:hypothetical protein
MQSHAGVPLVTLVELARGPHGHWSSPWVSHLHEQQVIAAAVHSGDKQVGLHGHTLCA